MTCKCKQLYIADTLEDEHEVVDNDKLLPNVSSITLYIIVLMMTDCSSFHWRLSGIVSINSLLGVDLDMPSLLVSADTR